MPHFISKLRCMRGLLGWLDDLNEYLTVLCTICNHISRKPLVKECQQEGLGFGGNPVLDNHSSYFLQEGTKAEQSSIDTLLNHQVYLNRRDISM